MIPFAELNPLYWIALLVGVPLLFIAVGLGSLFALWRFHRRAEKALGLVVGFKETRDEEGNPVYRSIVQFDAGDRRCEITDALGNQWRWNREGQEVWVHYPPDRPEEARIWRPWVPLVFAGLAVLGGTVLALAWTRL
jgi:hypothetical protein